MGDLLVKVSVLLAVCNGERFLPAQLASLSTQTESGVSGEQTTTRQLVDSSAESMVSVRIRLTCSSSVSRKARLISS